MRIQHSSAVELEMIVRKVFSCNRSGMGGYIDADHFESSPFDAALIALAPLWQNANSRSVGDFLFKWEQVFRDETSNTCEIELFVQELEDLVDTLIKP